MIGQRDRRTRLRVVGFGIGAAALVMLPQTAYGMHLSEGILPTTWWSLWTFVALPFVAASIWKVKKLPADRPEWKAFIGMVGAAVFIISCMPIPVPTAGTCSHPCGTGVAAILIGPLYTILVASISLLIQALFLAHGGLTTWGADVVSMGVVGAFGGYLTFHLLRKCYVPVLVCAFAAGLMGDWLTYATTSLEIATALHGDKSVSTMFLTVLVAFAPTQIPLGIFEGFLAVGTLAFIRKRRPDILAELSKMQGEPSPPKEGAAS